MGDAGPADEPRAVDDRYPDRRRMVEVDSEADSMGTGLNRERPFFLLAYGAAVLAVDENLISAEAIRKAAFATFDNDMRHIKMTLLGHL